MHHLSLFDWIKLENNKCHCHVRKIKSPGKDEGPDPGMFLAAVMLCPSINQPN